MPLISKPRLARVADPRSGETDEAVLATFEAYQPSQNADAAFQSLLGAACAIGIHLEGADSFPGDQSI